MFIETNHTGHFGTLIAVLPGVLPDPSLRTFQVHAEEFTCELELVTFQECWGQTLEYQWPQDELWLYDSTFFPPSWWMLQFSLIWTPTPFSHFWWCIFLLSGAILPGCLTRGHVQLFRAWGRGSAVRTLGHRNHPPATWGCALTTSMDTNSSRIFMGCVLRNRERGVAARLRRVLLPK